MTPTPPVNGHATFIRRNGRRSLNESLPTGNNSSSVLSIDHFSRTNNSKRKDDNDDDDDDEDFNRQKYRPPSSSTTNASFPAPPIKPRKSSSTPNSSIVNLSKPQQNNHYNNINSNHSDDDDEDDGNSLRGHGSDSDVDEDQLLQHERPNSRLSLRNGDDRSQQQSNGALLRPHHKQAKQSNRNPTYDDYRYLDEQPSPSSPNKPKQQNVRSLTNKDFPQPSSNRIGSGNGPQSSTNRLKSGSKSSSTESIPTLDLTVAGQKVFRTKHQSEISLTNSLPYGNTVRPPSGRLKPLNSAKSSSSYTDELSSKTLEDVTNNVKQSSPTKTHLYKKKLAPLINGNDAINKKYSYRPLIDQQQLIVDDVPSDKSEETSTGGGNRSDKRSKYH